MTPMLPIKFRVTGPFYSGEEDFQDGNFGHLIFPIGTILAIFDLQVTSMILISFKSNGLSVQEKKPKIDYQDGHYGGHLVYPI